MVILLIQMYGHVKQVAVMVVAGETMNFSIIQTVQKIHMYQMEH